MAGRTNGFDPQVGYAALDERMTNISGRVNTLDANMTRAFSALESQLAALSDKFAASRAPQWQALGVCMTVFTVVGYMSLQPLRESAFEVKAMVVKLADENISPEERKYRTERNTEDRQRQEANITDTKADIAQVRLTYVPIAQWQEQVKGRDAQLTEMMARIEEVRSMVNTVYSARDVIMDMRNQLIELRQRIETQPALSPS